MLSCSFCRKNWRSATLAAALGLAALSACDARRESVTERARHAADPRPQATAGAGGTDGAPHPGADAGSAGTPEPEADPRFAAHLDDPADFARLQGEQWSVKYLARIDGRQPPHPLDRECTFQDTAAYPLHLDFLRTIAGLGTLDFNTYLTLVVHRASRVLWGGELRLFSGARHPRTGIPGVMGLFVYADDEEPLGTEQLIEIYRRIEGCAPYARDMLVLVGADTEQASRLREQADDLDDAGISVVDVVDLVNPDVAAEGYIREENRVLKEALRAATGKTQIPLTNEQRRRLASKGKALTPAEREECCQIVRPNTILAWFRQLVARRYDSSQVRRPGRPRKANQIRQYWKCRRISCIERASS